MPIFIIIIIFFTMANLGLPGTSSFVGEFLLLVSAFEANTTSCFLATLPKLKGITAQLIRLKMKVIRGANTKRTIFAFVGKTVPLAKSLRPSANG